MGFPEYVISMEKISKSTVWTQSNQTSPFHQVYTHLNQLAKTNSPYLKLFHLRSALCKITESVENFYKSKGINIVLAITAEELFPIMLEIVKNAEAEFVANFSIDLLIASMFLPEGMMSGEVGWSMSNWLAVHEYFLEQVF